MKRVQKGFTLMELLVSMGVLATLYALSAPMIKQGKGAVAEFQAVQSAHQLSLAMGSYLSDYDDIYPLGMIQNDDKSLDAWFGKVSPSGKVDAQAGSMSNYLGKKFPQDPTAPKLDYLGNHTGFGYNLFGLGSDLLEKQPTTQWPSCSGPASQTNLTSPSNTIVFGSSAFVRAPWKGGDGQAYDFGFITPPSEWKGVPTVDFRHKGKRSINAENKTVESTGFAIVIFADGSARPVHAGGLKDTMFTRDPGTTEQPPLPAE